MVTGTAKSGMVILDPTLPPLAVDARLATRPMDLNGKVLGLGVEIHSGFTILHVAEEAIAEIRLLLFTEDFIPARVMEEDHLETVSVRPLRPDTRRKISGIQKYLVTHDAMLIRRPSGLTLAITDAHNFIECHKKLLNTQFKQFYQVGLNGN